jgi:hypothetical protein
MTRARHSYKLALRAKGIRPIPPHRHLRSAGKDAHVIQNPALAKSTANSLQPPARGEAFSEPSAT